MIQLNHFKDYNSKLEILVFKYSYVNKLHRYLWSEISNNNTLEYVIRQFFLPIDGSSKSNTAMVQMKLGVMKMKG